ncbi:MAG: hypothetical protein MK108_03780 [Mariniblastus sp.]|nr:hypothetical protein [Mariniblastus sp.]
MKRLFPFIAWTVLLASTGVVRPCSASIESALDSREMVDQISSGSDSDGPCLPEKPQVEKGNPPSALPCSIASGALASHAFGLHATFPKTGFKFQLSSQHKVYLKTTLQWPTPPLWEILKVPIVTDSNRALVN